MIARNFGRLALVLVALFASLVAAALFPVELLNPVWESRFIAAVLNAATLPLFALALLQLAAVLDPAAPALQRQRQLFSSLAIPAAIGFLLLIPLQVFSSLNLQATASQVQTRRLDQAARQLSEMRQALRQADSAADLNARLRRVNGPALEPADQLLPLPVLKAQVASVFDLAQRRLERERSAFPSVDPLRLLPELLRTAVACLALACGYATFARLPGSELSLFDAVLLRLRRPRRERRPSDSSEAEYIRQLSGEDQP
ncbi:MAG: hypothetical protein VKI83_08530 [Synechococcaceae cyanobacterium]|nr:hypothetical protein [Synechococcaceae cyanobacterium]